MPHYEENFVTVPDVTLPDGTVVPSFKVSTFLCTAGEPHSEGAACRRIGDRVPRAVAIMAGAYPWVSLSYHDTRKACAAAGFQLITERQYLAIAHDIARQDINWTGGKVGEGELFQGLHLDSVDCAMPATFEPKAEAERRWHQLSNGERLYDIAGNAFSWVFDDVQGDENGLVAKPFAADSLSLLAPYPFEQKGMGWRPNAGRDWSGGALIRGGCWGSGVDAGAFNLVYGWPGSASDSVGFRCTKSL